MTGYDPDAILADPDAHPVHKHYAAINVGIRDRAERWAKCLNCGEPYQVTTAWTSDLFCGSVCEADYAVEF